MKEGKLLQGDNCVSSDDDTTPMHYDHNFNKPEHANNENNKIRNTFSSPNGFKSKLNFTQYQESLKLSNKKLKKRVNYTWDNSDYYENK